MSAVISRNLQIVVVFMLSERNSVQAVVNISSASELCSSRKLNKSVGEQTFIPIQSSTSGWQIYTDCSSKSLEG